MFGDFWRIVLRPDYNNRHRGKRVIAIKHAKQRLQRVTVADSIEYQCVEDVRTGLGRTYELQGFTQGVDSPELHLPFTQH